MGLKQPSSPPLTIVVPALSAVRADLPDTWLYAGANVSLVIEADDQNADFISSLDVNGANGESIQDYIPVTSSPKSTNAGQHPVEDDQRTRSVLVLYNDDSKPRLVGLKYFTSDGQRLTTTLELGANETKTLEPNRSLERSSTAPAGTGLDNGVITWESLETSSVFGRVLHIDKRGQFVRSFSCPLATIACAATVNPGLISALPGGTYGITGYANTCPSSGQCSCNGSGSCTATQQTVSSNSWSVSDSNIAYLDGTTASNNNVHGNSGGDTTVSLTVRDSSVYSCSANTGNYGGTPGRVSVQVPTSRRTLQTTANYQVGADQDVCQNSGGKAGWYRAVTRVLTDQNTPARDINVSGQSLTETVTIDPNQNDLNITGVQTGYVTTDAAGYFPDVLYVCSALCPSSTGRTVATQTITSSYASRSYTIAPSTFTYTCQGNYIDGQ